MHERQNITKGACFGLRSSLEPSPLPLRRLLSSALVWFSWWSGETRPINFCRGGAISDAKSLMPSNIFERNIKLVLKRSQARGIETVKEIWGRETLEFAWNEYMEWVMGEWLPTSRRDNLWAYHCSGERNQRNQRNPIKSNQIKEIDDSRWIMFPTNGSR